MIKKKLIIILISAFLIVAFTESYDVKGIEDLDYVIAIGFDKSKENPENFEVTFQIAKPKDKETGKTEAKTATIECPTFDIGLSAINNFNDKILNLSHCSALVISDEIAKDGIEPIILNTENNVELRPTCNLLISKGSAKSFINTIGESPDFSSDVYLNLINSSLSTGYTSKSLLYDFYSDMRYNIKQPVAMYVKSEQKSADPIGLTVFKNDKMVGTLSGTEVICHNILTNKLNSAKILVPNPFEKDKYLTADISLSKKTSISSEFQDDQSVITCTCHIKSRISSSQTTNDDYTSKDQNEMASKAIEDYLYSIISNYLEKITNQYDSDIVGFEGTIRKKFLTMDEYRNKVDWENQFKNTKFKINIDNDLDSSYLFQRH